MLGGGRKGNAGMDLDGKKGFMKYFKQGKGKNWLKK